MRITIGLFCTILVVLMFLNKISFGEMVFGFGATLWAFGIAWGIILLPVWLFTEIGSRIKGKSLLESKENWLKLQSISWPIATVIAIVTIAVPHFSMAIQLDGLKASFDNVVETHGAGKTVGRTLDFGGKLDAIDAKRDKMLEEHQYLRIGKWSVKNRDTGFITLYLYNPFSKKFVSLANRGRLYVALFYFLPYLRDVIVEKI